jgi:very-short-patch-repair endonuclease
MKPRSSVANAITPERREKVDKARAAWIKKLIDLSRRNNLLFYRALQTGTLDISDVSPAALSALLNSDPDSDGGVPLSRLVPEAPQQAAAAARLKEIAKRAQENLEERGLDTLFLGVGMASWQPEDGGRPGAAPVLLMPLSAMPLARESRSWVLKRNGDLRINDVLLHALEVQHGVTIDADELLSDLHPDTNDADLDLASLFNRLSDRAGEVPGFAVASSFIVSNFHFQKLAIVRDLQEHGNELAAHDLIAGIAGDVGARERVRGDRSMGDPRELDTVEPDDEFLVLDADSTQQQAIGLAVSGRSGVISGPPGTGKSQTIANLIADSAARGKAVLFVAEKRAALDVVLERLRAISLGHLCLDLHGADISRKVVARQLKNTLDLIRSVPRPDTESLHRQFTDRREQLNAHVRRLHQRRAPANLSVYEVFGRLADLPPGAHSNCRWAGKELLNLTAQKADRAASLVEELASGFAGLIVGDDPSPWTGATVPTTSQAQEAIDCALRLAQKWPALVEALRRVESGGTARSCGTVADISKLLDVATAIDSARARYDVSVFELTLDQLAIELSPGRSVVGRLWAFCMNGSFRDARADLFERRNAGRVSVPTLIQEVDELRATKKKWQEIAEPGAAPRQLPDVQALRRVIVEVLPDLKGLSLVFPGRSLETLSLTTLTDWLPALAADGVTPFRIVKAVEIEKALQEIDAGRTLKEIRRSKPDAKLWSQLFRYAWLRSSLDEAWRQDPSIPAFSGRTHDNLVEHFKTLDRQRLEVAIERVRRAHAERVVAVRNQHREQDAILSREAEKRSRHLPLRQLLTQAPDVLLALVPCWMASPLSVSQLIPASRPLFDLVIFDEASQVLPEDAAAALLRGRQAVVAGDRNQLPPTAFFAATDDETESEDSTGLAGFESILDQMSAFLEPAWSLDWHYRSRDEGLIAFSNHHIYGDRLVTFPAAARTPAITHHLENNASTFESEESVGAEVEKVVQLVLHHARTRPDVSLGVIAMGIKHARRVEAAIDRARAAHPELDDFFAPDRHERCFVKNLERVQGDERDAIILTVGYGKDAAGKLLYRFGPLLSEGGERRLNVAITRARQRMDVVSSFSHHDMALGRSKAKGVELLRAYLEYAASGGRCLASSVATDVPMNEFERSVHDALTAHGLNLQSQVGTSKYRIDLVALHPNQPGRPVLAIECDGASYHASPTARDRDRLRQQHLEALGWTFHRVWSTDWFLRRDQEITRALSRFKAACDHLDELPSAPSPTTPTKRPTTVETTPVRTPNRGPQPVLPGRGSIASYSEQDLDQMVRWVKNGELRTDDEIIREVAERLGFKRLGRQIEEAIRRAVQRAS